MKQTILCALTILVFVVGCPDDKVPQSPPTPEPKIENQTQSKLIRIFPSETPGHQADAATIRRMFEPDFPVEMITYSGNAEGSDGRTKPSQQGKALVNIFIEHVWDYHATKQAKFNFLLVNQEFVAYPRRLENIDVVLCKTKVGARLMLNYAKKYKLKFKVYYTKFTTPMQVIENVKKDYNLAVHLAGKSPFKNTAVVMEAWFKHADFPNLKITCRAYSPDSPGGCFPQQASGILAKHRVSLVGMEAHPTKHVELFIGMLDGNVLSQWQDTAGYYITPSSIEGYGHYINEGRAHGAIVITTDAAPMNEMVENGVSGFVVPTSGSSLFNEYSGAREYSISESELVKVMKKAIALTTEQKIEMGKRARQAYLDDTKFYEQRMKVIADSLKAHEDLSLVPKESYADMERGSP